VKQSLAEFDAEVERLLADPANIGHPLHTALKEMLARSREQAVRIERIAQISDAYQTYARERELTLHERLDKHLHQLEKVARISDRYQHMMHDQNMSLREASTHDPLTGLANRRLAMERLKEEGERAKRHQHPLVIAMLDVDHFKRVNDDYGHEVGDQVLTDIAHTIDAQLRDYDLCGRWGGEEFLLLFPETNMADALAIVERVQKAVRELVVRVGDSSLPVTVSVGIAEWRDDERYSDTLNRADAALLGAKREGRDRCLVG
jgi:diguanylate cyclase (GGDEF)-like protein